ncbi:MAG: Mur ligase family protein, partial [Vicinamibacterales bacterium]
AIADAKAEVLEGAGRGDLLVYNADDPRVTARVGAFLGRKLSFGLSERADVRAEAVEDLGVDGTRARLVTATGSRPIRTPLLGRGNLSNVLAASAVALDSGVELDEIAARVGRLTPADRRGAVRRLSGGITLIDDSYNSSPSALRRALDVVARDASAARKVVVLGEMLELGDHAVRLHEECGRAAAASGAGLLFAVGGAPARALARAAVDAGLSADAVSHFDSSEAAAPAVAAALRPGDLVLVKGSRGSRTDTIADRIAGEHA